MKRRAVPGKINMNPKSQARFFPEPRRPGLGPVPLFLFALLCLCACSGQKSKKDKTFSRVALARYSPDASSAGSALKKGFSLKFGPKFDLSNSWLCLASPACSCSLEGQGLVLASPKPEMGFEFESPLVGDFTLEVSYEIVDFTAETCGLGLAVLDSARKNGCIVGRARIKGQEVYAVSMIRDNKLAAEAVNASLTDHARGGIRLKRRKGTFSGYYLKKGEWVGLGRTGVKNVGPLRLALVLAGNAKVRFQDLAVRLKADP